MEIKKTQGFSGKSCVFFEMVLMTLKTEAPKCLKNLHWAPLGRQSFDAVNTQKSLKELRTAGG